MDITNLIPNPNKIFKTMGLKKTFFFFGRKIKFLFFILLRGIHQFHHPSLYYFFTIPFNKEGMDCGICYYNYTRVEDIFPLTCCKNNILCLRCVQLLTTPLCPFCRARIPDLPEKPRMAISYEAESTLTPSPSREWRPASLPLSATLDEAYIDSRTMRRRLRRLRKLQQREDDRVYNRNLTRVMRESRSSMRNDIYQQIQEDREIFEMDL